MIAAALAVAAFAAQEPEVATPLADVAVAAPLTFAILTPGELVREAARGFRECGAGPFDRTALELDTELVAALAEFGVALDDPASWARGGIDAARPITLSMADPGGWFIPFPRTSWWTFGVGDRELAARFLAAVQKPPAAGRAWRLQPGLAFALSTTRDDLEPDERLDDVLAGAAATLGADPLGAMVAARSRAAARCALWLEPRRFVKSNPVRAILGVVTDAGLEIGIAPAPDTGWFDGLHAGGSARDLLSRFDRPVIAISASLAEPLRAFDGFARDAEIDAELRAVIDRVLALAGTDLGERLADGSAGALLYPRGGAFDAPRVALGVHVHGVDVLLAKARASAEAGELPLELDGTWLRARLDGKDVVLGAVGDYLTFGDAVDEIRRAARGAPGGWSPVCGGHALLACEVDLVALALATEVVHDDADLALLERQGALLVEVERGDAGLAVRLGFRGAEDDASFVRRAMRVLGVLLAR